MRKTIDPGSADRPAASDSVTGRFLRILAAFTAGGGPLTLSEISRRTGISLTSTHRHVGEMLRWGALERDAEGRYAVGLRLWEVGSLAPRSIGLRDAALPVMQDLYEITHENVQIAVLQDREVVYLERISGRRAVHVVTRPGTRLAPHATAVGLVLLAHASPDLVDDVLAGPLKRYTEHTITDRDRIRAGLAEVRRQGYAVSDRQIEEVACSVAAPILDARREVIAALSVVIPAASGRTRRYIPAVQASARAISRSLGAVF